MRGTHSTSSVLCPPTRDRLCRGPAQPSPYDKRGREDSFLSVPVKV